MSTHSRQNLSSILALVSILALLLLLVFVWAAVQNDAFDQNERNVYASHRSDPFNSINLSEVTTTAATTASSAADTTAITSNRNDSLHHHGYHSRHPHHWHPMFSDINTIRETTDNSTSALTHHNNHSEKGFDKIPNDVDATAADELVKPSKMNGQPLHAADLLYESMKVDPNADIEGKVLEHRGTGQYRNKSNRVWDPHPHYLIDAFGLHLHLILHQDNKFIPKNLKITHIWHNEMQRKVEDHKDHEQLRGCFYRGHVRADDRSTVAVSLCDGMHGHIYTSSGSFFIEPIEEYTVDNQNILHKISREKLLDDKLHSDKSENGKVLIDDISSYDISSSSESVGNSKAAVEDTEDDLQPNVNSFNGPAFDISWNISCSTQDGQNCSIETAESMLASTTKYFDGTTYTPIIQSDFDGIEDLTMQGSEFNETKSATEDELKFETTTTTTTTAPPRSSRKKRHITNNHYYGSNSAENNAYTMEVMVVVDRKMQEYHGQNIKAYVLTLMSIVSNIYADASIGNSIDVAVVHIMLLKDDLHVESNDNGFSASHMLNRFCKFIRDYPFQRDTALLLTRKQICRNANEKKCDTLGLAELGTICLERSCAIVQDNGLSAAFTIAHELGHVLSMPHDQDTKCSKFQNEDGRPAQNIMAHMLDHNSHPWSWSACSRHYVTEYLEHNHGTCMLNKPTHDMIETTSPLLAGEKFSVNQQCALVFGPHSKVCPFTVILNIGGREVPQLPCVSLWCGLESEGCRTNHMPWADGTECGAGHWCQHGQCVLRNRKVKIDGEWGPWKPFGQCSRHCGGGVESSTRECNSPAPANGGKYCIGTRIKYRSCNIHDCPSDMLDFRAQQCAEMNNNSFGIQGLDSHVRWVPKYGQSPHDECKLYCRVEQTYNYFLLSDKVKDGTLCNQDTFDKCVNGFCQPAGCNNQLDSNAKLDKCGVCNGKNETCLDIEGVFRPEHIERAKEYSQTPYYYHVTVIPEGASNIEIKQPGSPDDLNYIALMDDQGAYILNGHNVITQYPRVFPYGGVTFEYTGTNSSIERVNTTFAKRLNRDLTVEILSRSTHFESEELIRYVYTMRLNETRYSHTSFYPYEHHQNHNQPIIHRNGRHYGTQYKWEMSDWSECNNLCDGQQYRTAACKQIDNGRTVSPNMCLDRKPDDQYKVCNAGCVVEWEIQRSKCSVECGEGVQQLSFKCIQTFPQSNHRKVVDEVHCPSSRKTKLYEKCHGACASAIRTYGEYGSCSKSCNGGKQSRTAYCTSHGQMIDERYCAHLTKDNLERSCNTHKCPKWQYSDESSCSVTCGTGFKVRSAICVQNDKIININECDEYTKPKDVRSSCQLDPCWRKNPTSNPVLYSKGINRNNNNNNRNYHNRYDAPDRRSPKSNIQTTYSTNGGIYQKPPTTIPAPTTTTATTSTTTMATTTAVNPYRNRQTYRFTWRTSRWSPCSATCDGGVRRRDVRCVSETTDQTIDDRYCTDAKPDNMTNCAHQRCPKWRSGHWGECNDDCKRHRQVVCQDERHHSDIANCSLNTRPHSTEECCRFRWKNLWSPCSAECGSGTKSRQRVCMKLFLANQYSRQQMRKKNRPVNEHYCSQMKQPPFIPMIKECRKQNCPSPKWELGAWSGCSVGCGKGYSLRQLVCTLNGGPVNQLICSNLPKPQESLTRHCETFNQCKWKIGAWKQCSCTGYTRRKVQCFDMNLNRQSKNCPEQTKPELRKRCAQPPNCSCKGLQRAQRKYHDADYPLIVRGREVHIYCHGMNTTNPKEYITLRDHRENYSSYYERRSRRANECVREEIDQVIDPSLPSGITYFSKVRLDTHTLQVIIDDFTFARTMGRQPQPFGSAGDCFSTTQRCPRGSFSINFVNTNFRIRPKTRWDTHGVHAIQQFHGFEAPYQKVASVCGGYCGKCSPSHETGLHLELI